MNYGFMGNDIQLNFLNICDLNFISCFTVEEKSKKYFALTRKMIGQRYLSRWTTTLLAGIWFTISPVMGSNLYASGVISIMDWVETFSNFLRNLLYREFNSTSTFHAPPYFIFSYYFFLWRIYFVFMPFMVGK